MKNMINNINSHHKLAFIASPDEENRCQSYWAIVTPPKKIGTSFPDCGECYLHTEITIAIIEQRAYIRCCAVYNNHARVNSSQSPYYPGKKIFHSEDSPELHMLIEQLRQIATGELILNEKEYTNHF
jgi:hypothetical protein